MNKRALDLIIILAFERCNSVLWVYPEFSIENPRPLSIVNDSMYFELIIFLWSIVPPSLLTKTSLTIDSWEGPWQFY